MNKSVAYYISELLYLHDCVIVPKFGGFVSSRKAARLNKISGRLTPPSKHILFNKNLKTNDGLLIMHIAQQEGIAQKTAQQHVEIFSKKINTKLSTSKVLRIADIGLFTVGKDETIIFLQDSSINYSLDAFGMKPSYNKPIIRKTDPKIENTVHIIKNTTTNPKAFFRAAVIITALFTLGYLSISQQERVTNVYTQMATFSPFSSIKPIEKINEVNKEPLKIKLATTTADKKANANSAIINPSKKEKPLTIIAKKTYYIIGGAFAEQKNANKMYNKLRNLNYNADIIRGGPFLRVSYSSFQNKENALLALNKIKQEHPEAWLLAK